MKQLYLQDNDIVLLPISGFGELTSLEVLYMQNNRIGVLTRQMLLGIDNVRVSISKLFYIFRFLFLSTLKGKYF